MPLPAPDRLRAIKTLPSLVAYLRDELEWPIDSDDVEEISYTYAPEELGLDAEHAVKINQIRQIRPLVTGQPWGIFWVSFEKKRLPVAVLRRILGSLVIKSRQSANNADRPRWKLQDLLFVSAYGDEDTDQREIAFAHFSQTDGDLPTLRVLDWAGSNAALQLNHVAHTLADKLRWPQNPADTDAWRQRWSSAFRHPPRHTIKTAALLAETLAQLARDIRDAASKLLEAESDRGPLTKLFKAFQAALIHELTPETFADTYAQTITYGLLTAAINRTDMSGGTEATYVKADDLTLMARVTSPFLKEMLETFLTVGGRKNGVDFDELGIQDVVELLRGNETDLPEILRNFGDKKPGEDPVIHFYEDFAKAYDAETRIKRGEFYTPQPVVSYIVRSVHELLQTEFGLEDGLASTVTWGEMLKLHSDLKLPSVSDDPAKPEFVKESEPFVQILDPATGTATFLVEVIEVIFQHLKAKWATRGLAAMPRITLAPVGGEGRGEGATIRSFTDYWNLYVPQHLLPRLHGYELLAAPYAIAHLKLGLKLTETGYRFGSAERARIYLTNALEPKVRQLPQIGFEPLAHEAKAVNEIKWYKRFTVVIGNPPYSGVSANNSETAVRLVDAYKFVDGEPLGERKHWLQDDYKKFVRIAQIKIETAGAGIVGYITNHGYLDDPTARGMRRSLMQSFPTIHLLDAHGSLKKREVCPDGTTDQNLFDIEPGVSIGLFHKAMGPNPAGLVKHAHLWGLETAKSRFLASHQLSTTDWIALDPKPRFYLFTPSDSSLAAEYENSVRLVDVFSVSTVGCVTARDGLTIHWNADDVWNTVADFASLPVETARTKYELGKDVRDWTVEGAQRDVRASGPTKSLVAPVLYRPFDQRFTYYTGQSRGFIGQPQPKVMRQFLRGPNLGLSIGRQGQAADTDEWSVVFCTKFFTEFNLFRRGGNNLNPLYAYPADNDGQRQLSSALRRSPNLTPSFLKALATRLELRQADEYGLPAGLTPEDIFYYAYAVFHSPGYRSRYAEFLKIDFPRLPLTGNLELFRALARLGDELVALHLLESPKLEKPITKFIGPASPVVDKITYEDTTVWLGKAKTTGFRGVPEPVWNFHIGGYQVCEKWLKDRKGRTLTTDDIAHYHKIVVALSETIRLMAEIDAAIEKHGGWPVK
jgi:hypothetical protein